MPTRRIRWAAGFRIGAALVLGAAAVLAADEGTPGGRARDLIRQEAAARARERAAQLARLRALPNPPPARLGVWQQVGPGPLMAFEADEGDDADDDGAPAAVTPVYTEQAFDFYLLGGHGTTDRWRAELHQGLEREVGFLTTSRGLTPAERAKLLLAGKGDVKRHFDRIEAKRAQFRAIRRDVAKARTFLMDLHNLGRETRFGAWGNHGSLFNKVLKTIGEHKSGRT